MEPLAGNLTDQSQLGSVKNLLCHEITYTDLIIHDRIGPILKLLETIDILDALKS